MFPYLYKKPQLDLFYQLVNEANPGITKDIVANSSLGVPVAQAIPSTGFPANTNIVINGKAGYIGNKRVTYRRLSLNDMFKGMTVTLTNYVAGTTLPIATVVDTLNTLFGLPLLTSDFSIASINTGSTTLTFVPGSLCFQGSFTITWTKGKQKITDLLPNNSNLTGRLFPGGNAFPVGRKPQGEYLCYDTTFSPLATTFAPLTTGTLSYANTAHKTIIDFLTANVSSTFNGGDHTTNGGLQGLTFVKYTLPNNNVPEANSASPNYKNVFVIQALAGSWFQGKMLLHYSP